ncbi:hypothetical protein [Methylosinus sporium]|uniref:hypothetical protein n=1 Tax=Methylosinus sporium TaxID=428 RepID=UPI00383B0855
MNGMRRFFIPLLCRRAASAMILALSALACSAFPEQAMGGGSRAQTLRIAFNADNPLLTSLASHSASHRLANRRQRRLSRLELTAF